MSFAYVRRYASFPFAPHFVVSNIAVKVRYAVLGSPSENLTHILSLFVETHVVFFIGTVAAAETPELAEARRLGKTDAISKGFDWKFFAASNLVSNSALIVIVSATRLVEESNLYNAAVDTLPPGCWVAAYLAYNLTPTAIALLHSPVPPADRLLGKSPEWINAYTTAYQSGVKRARAEASIAGCFAGTASLAATTYLILSAVGVNRGDGY